MSKRIIDLPTGSLSPTSLTFIGDPTSGSLSQVTYAAIKAFFQSTGSGQISGSGLDGFLPLWKGSQFLTSSAISQSGANLSLGLNTILLGTASSLRFDQLLTFPRILSNGSLILQGNSQNTVQVSVSNAIGTGFNNGSVFQVINGGSMNSTSGNITLVDVNTANLTHNSGSQSITNILLDGTIVQTGSYNGIVRGLYYNPTIQSLASSSKYIAFENTVSSNAFNTIGGSTFIGFSEAIISTTSSFKLLVSGSTFISGNLSSSNYIVASQGIVVNPSGFAADGLTPVSGLPLITSVSNNATYNVGAGQGFSHNFQTNGLSRLLISDGTILVGNGTIQQPASQSTGNIILFNVSSSYVPITGSGTNFTALGITTNINQSTTGSGIMRGLYINSNVVNAIDYRALEISSGRSVFSGSIAISGSVTASVSVVAPAAVMDFIGVATNNLRRQNPGQSILMWADNTNNGGDGWTFQYQTTTSNFATSSNNNYININPSFQPQTGSATWNVIAIQPLVSQSLAVSNGITRGIFINPNLTSSADWRAIEVIKGRSIFNDTVQIVHLIGSGSSLPTSITGSASGTGATTSVTGSDLAGVLNLNTGISVLTTGSIATVNFNTSYSRVPYVIFSPANASAAGATGIFVTATTSSFTINDTSTLSISSTYSWNYQVVQ